MNAYRPRVSSRAARRISRRGSFLRPRLEFLEDRVCPDTVTIDGIDSGWYNQAGTHTAGLTNYFAGQCFGCGPAEFRNFFAFDLSSLRRPIAEAELRVLNPIGGYNSPDPTETYTLFDVSTPVDILRAGGTGLTQIFQDLGTGAVHGQRVFSAADSNRMVTIPLTTAAVAHLNLSRSGQVALGGALTTISGTATQSIFGPSSGGPTRQLVLTLGSPAGPIVIGHAPVETLDFVSSVRVTFDRAMDVATFTPDQVHLAVGPLGPLTIDAVTVVPNSGEREFDIHFAPQSFIGTYYLVLGPDILDTEGNLMDQTTDEVPGQADDYYLATITIRGPRIVAATPAGTLAPPVSSVRVTFNKPIQPESFTPADVVYTAPGGGTVPITAIVPVPGSNDTQFDLQFTSTGLTGEHRLVIGPDILDVFYNPLDQNANFIPGETPDDQFTTSFSLTGTRVTAATPTGTLAPPLSSVRVTFSRSIVPESFTPADVVYTVPNGGTVPLTGVVPVPGSNNTQFDLQLGAAGLTGTHRLVLGPDIRDVFGNQLDQNDNRIAGEIPGDQFTTTFTLTGTRVTAGAPFPGANPGVGAVRLEFSRAMDPSSFTPADIVSFTAPGGLPVPVFGVSVVAGTNNTRFDVSFVPLTTYGAYQFVLGPDIRDMFGNQLDQNDNRIPGEVPGDRYTTSFTIGSLRVTASTPTGTVTAVPSSVRVTFNRFMDASTFTAADVTFTGPGGTLPVTGVAPVAGSNGTLFDVTFGAQARPGNYRMVIGPDIRDAYGNLMDQDNDLFPGEPAQDQYIATFTLRGPRLTAQTPSSSPLAAPTIGSLRVTFNRSMDPDSFTVDDVVSFTAPGSVAIPVTSVAVVPNTNNTQFELTFAPQGRTGRYTLVLAPTIMDPFGTRLDQNDNLTPGEDPGDRYTGTFSIVGVRVSAQTPTGGNLGAISSVRLTFNRAMDPATFTISDVVSFTGPLGGIPVTDVTVVPNTNNTQFELTFTPQAAFGSYTLTVGPDIRDTFGNQLDQNGNLTPGEATADRYAAFFRLVIPCQGPDGASYYACATPTTGLPSTLVGDPAAFTILSTGVNTFAAVNLGTRTFTLYGVTYSGANTLFVSSNGLITFGSGNGSPDNSSLTSSPTQAALAPLWDDWRKLNSGPMVLGKFDDANHRLIIEWNQVNHHYYDSYYGYDYFSPRAISFQAVLRFDSAGGSSVYFNYLDLDTGDSAANGGEATVGLKAAGTQGTNRLLVLANNSSGDYVASGKALVVSNQLGGPFVVTASLSSSLLPPVDRVRVTFAWSIDVATFTLSDVTLTGPGGTIAVASVVPVPGSSNTQFDLTFASQGRTGMYTLILAADIRDEFGTPLDQNHNGVPGEETADRFVATFGIVGTRITAAAPTGNATPGLGSVRVTFTRTMDATTFTAADVTLTGPGGSTIPVTGITPVAGSNNTQFDLMFAAQGSTGTYTLVVGPDVRDTYGNQLDQNNNLIPGEATADRFTSTFTLRGTRISTAVAPDLLALVFGTVRVTFNRPMDPATFTSDDVAFTGPTGAIAITAITPVPGTSNAQFEVAFAPQGRPGSYRLVLGPDIRDTFGNQLDQDDDLTPGEPTQDQVTTTFTLRGAQVVGYVPNGTLAPPVGSVRVLFNRSMDAATFTPEDVVLTGPAGAIAIIAVYPTPASDDTQFDLYFPEQTGTGVYRLVIGPDIRDTFGNQLDQNDNLNPGETPADQFLGGFALPGPVVTAATQIGSSTLPVYQVRVTFSRPMNLDTFTTEDIVEFTGPQGAIELYGVFAVDGSNGTQYDLFFPLQTALGSYRLVFGPDIQDLAGNLLDQNGNFTPGETPGDRYTLGFRIVEPVCIGFDAFGHGACVQSFEDIDLEANQPGVVTLISAGDNVTAAVSLGTNSFTFYGTRYTGATPFFVSSNGLLTFVSSSTVNTNTDLTTSPTQRTIAPLWDDWINAPGRPLVLSKVDGDRLMIEWNDVRHVGTSPSGVTFQVILGLNTGTDAGSISFNYVDLVTGNSAFDNGVSATVGIKDQGTQGPNRMLLSFNALNPYVGDGQNILTFGPGGGGAPGSGGGPGSWAPDPVAVLTPDTLPETTLIPVALKPAAVERYFSAAGAQHLRGATGSEERQQRAAGTQTTPDFLTELFAESFALDL